MHLKKALPLSLAALMAVVAAPAATQATAGDDYSDVITGPGVTDTTIKLGVIVPLTGVLGPFGSAGLVGTQFYWDQQNENGGVCGRQVELVARDNQYNTQGSITAYAAIADDVAAINNISPGSDGIALRASLERDSMLALTGSYDAGILDVPTAIMPGTPYDIETINIISYLLDEGKIAAGDTLGVIAFRDGIGVNVVRGAEAAAEEFGLELVKREVDPTSTDMTAQITALRNADAKVIVMGTAAAQIVSAAAIADASNYDVTIAATNLLSANDVTGTAGNAIVERVILTSSNAPLSIDDPAAQAVVQNWQEHHDAAPSTAGISGYVVAAIVHSILNTACENKDLSREGIVWAFQNTSQVETHGLKVPLDYSRPGEPPSRAVFILQPDPEAVGGSRMITGPYTSDFGNEWSPLG